MFYIYQHHDPRNWDLVYIGLTDNLERRMKQHHFRSDSPVYPLAKELRSLGLQLHSCVLDSNPDFEVAKELEKKYIKEKKPILNTTHNVTSDVDSTRRLGQPVHQTETQRIALTQQSQKSMLWCAPVSPELIMRDFVGRHDKQAVYIDVRYAGALAALAKLVHKGNKTDLINEMIEDFLNKYAQVLYDNEDVVQIKEDDIRKKHHID